MSFELKQRTLAVAPDLVPVLFPQLLERFGEDLPDGTRKVRTIGGFDCGNGVLGAASLDIGSIAPVRLTDGRLAFSCIWQADLAEEFDAHGIPGVEELTPAQLSALTPAPEEMPL
ncbi:MAG: hypothetical protein WCQ16_02785 [Verrucomicrobiae bacterium]